MYVLSLHEGILDITMFILNNSEIPDYFKLSSYDTYSEGWIIL